MTSDGEVTADVVYAGFGVTAPELAYDDYKDIDVKDVYKRQLQNESHVS